MVETLRGELGIANAAPAKAEGVKELLSHQLEAKSKEASDTLAEVAAGKLRDTELIQKLADVEAPLEKWATDPRRVSYGHSPHPMAPD